LDIDYSFLKPLKLILYYDRKSINTYALPKISGAEMVSKKKCKKCGYEWLPRTEAEPTMCPKCKTRNWR
jgi:predicted Zn-ribbon and HTH transcriptional regulator